MFWFIGEAAVYLNQTLSCRKGPVTADRNGPSRPDGPGHPKKNLHNKSYTKKKKNRSHHTPNNMEKFTEQLKAWEEELAKCDNEIDRCVKEHTMGKISASQYFEQLRGIQNVDITDPQLPTGMVDAEEFRVTMSSSFYPHTTEVKLKLAVIEAKMQVYETTPNPNPSHRELSQKQNLCNERDKAASEVHELTKREIKARWSYLMQNGGVKVIDGKKFKAELSTLLKHKMDLTLMQTMSIAEQMPDVSTQKEQ